MKVHLLRSPELNPETYRNVLHLLQQFRGPVQFTACEEDVISFDDEGHEHTFDDRKDFEMIREDVCMSVAKEIEFPHVAKVKSWKQLFSQCVRYRTAHGIGDHELVILLTDVANDKNWFGSVSESMRDYFIHTADWDYYLGHSIDVRFPIAYEVIVWVIRHSIFSKREEILEYLHDQPRGCINDFCRDKPQIFLKMRTADVCSDCLERFSDRDLPVLYMRQFFEILDGIRKNMTFRERSALLREPSRLEVRGHSMRMFLTDLGDLELRFNPKEKALYLLFLNNPEGFYLHDVLDCKQELLRLYSRFCQLDERRNIEESIARLTDPLDNDIHVILSRIRRKLQSAVGESLLPYYGIEGERGCIRRIVLDRELVSYT